MKPSIFQLIFAGCAIAVAVILAASAIYFFGLSFLFSLVTDYNVACCIGGTFFVGIVILLLWVRFRLSLEQDH